MNAWQLTKEGLVLNEIEVPQPKAGEVLVKICAIGLNNVDMQVCRGDFKGINIPPFYPFTPGIEATGEIVALGAGVKFKQIGQRVSLHYYQNCGQCGDCASGKENICQNAIRRGRNAEGFWQEYVTIPEGFALPFSPDLPYTSAAALSVTAATAWNMLVERAQVKAGESVLIVGASSGIGLAAKELCWTLGANCILGGRGAKLVQLQEEGDYDCIDIESENWGTTLQNMGGVDVVYEAIGAKTLQQSLNALKPGGRLVLGGYASGIVAEINLIPFLAKEISLIGSSSWTRKTLEKVLQLAAQESLMPSIDTIMPFSQLKEGLMQLSSGKIFGKIVIEI